MKAPIKTLGLALGFAAAALGATAANAADRDRRIDRDDRIERAERIDRIDRRLDDRRFDARYDYNRAVRDAPRYRNVHHARRNGYRGPISRVVAREVYPTRFRARIVLREELIRTRRGPRLVCTVSARGPEAEFVRYRRLNRIAHRDCSRRSRIRIS